MEIEELRVVLASERDVCGLARTLGEWCLDGFDVLRNDRYADTSDAYLNLAADIATLSLGHWGSDGAVVRPWLEEEMVSLTPLSSSPELAVLGVLEGLCRGALRRFFVTTNDAVTINRGMCFPIPQRRITEVPATPNPALTHSSLLTRESGFLIWDSAWTLRLDFTFRDRLDDVCWPKATNDGPARRLAPIASVHPVDGAEMGLPDELVDGRFYGVRPSAESQAHLERVGALVAAAQNHASIVVLPEFSLAEPGDLAPVVKAHAEEGLDGVVVAGSAHARGATEARANVSMTYLDGTELLRTSKWFPYVLRVSGESGVQEFAEDLPPQPRVVTVAAGTSTYLAVAICSDLNSADMRHQFESACVNLMLVPAWTPKPGTFKGAIESLSAYSQCVSIVVNTPRHPYADGQEFWAMSATPHAPGDAFEHQPPDATMRVGVLDPSVPVAHPDHWRWIASRSEEE